MSTRTRRQPSIALSILVWAVLFGITLYLVWVIASSLVEVHQPTVTDPFSTSTDSCDVDYPPAPCLNAYAQRPLEDNSGLWALAGICFGAGFLISACAWLPLYRRGKRDERENRVTMNLHEVIQNKHNTQLYDRFAEDGL